MLWRFPPTTMRTIVLAPVPADGGAYPKGMRFAGLRTGRTPGAPRRRRASGGWVTGRKAERQRADAERVAASKARRAAKAKAAATRALSASRALGFAHLREYTAWVKSLG